MISTNKGQQTHLFQVEILVEGDTNAKAMEQLIHVLNNGGFPDYRVLSGSSLGQLIDTMREQHQSGQLKPEQPAKTTAAESQPALAVKSQTGAEQSKVHSGAESQSKHKIEQTASSSHASPFASIAAQFREYMEKNKLIRLKVNKGLGVSLSIPGRIINVDEASELLTVYHVDEKQVYTFKLNEIDDFSI
ncbi:hypothetical protein DFQ01_11029 [Paenibacillus cellulosilyticus]|uniref:Uncharacterized protein n=1 Tax=Paenibacillus cellulosilyticus TaxID=375489 RepID=A0A2V2YSJ7_9BACL|nr:hypothetical protein [Paenibacillus cellulosilyticus]PWW01139.1 hypothetical protein DFQ01_11029 [Paenibacillus cellulosilyticus]QKS46897.1 hypothetical protein HUB94_20675 [Paenibacillus cellulosilyticus]